MKMNKLILVFLMVFALTGSAFAATSTNTSTSSSGALAVIENPAGFLQQGGTQTYLLQIIPGVVGDITRNPNFPEFAGITKLRTTTSIVDLRTGTEVPYEYFDKLLAAGIPLAVISPDKVIKTEYYTRGGRWMGFTRLEDLETDVQDCIPKARKALGLKDDDPNIRLSASFKMSSKTIGANLGGTGQGAGFSPQANPVAWGGGSSGVVGVVINTADPKFQLLYHHIIPGAVKIFNVVK